MVISVSKKRISEKINIVGLFIMILGITLSIIFSDHKEMVYFLFFVSFLIYVIIISYKIRCFPSILIVENNELQIEYMSKSFFKMPPFKGSVENLTISTNKRNDLIIMNNESIVAIIIDNSIEKRDKDLLISILSETNL